ncbi:MAG: glutamate 5-kinase [Lachnospiraceae bacterium]|nr:glutamate 5-kinase [Clostridiales bacterium]MDD6293782.1 glutamate 5-kinase [Eubacteriales bacterium]MDY2606873.1 glutamate 5-kinase [Lachnospiraceae bacterium]
MEISDSYRDKLKDKKRIVVKIGSSSLTHPETNGIDLYKLEKLVRILTDIKNQGKDVILVSSGAIAVGKKSTGLSGKSLTLSEKQACAAIGQAQLMMMYQKLFSEYNQKTAQILMTKYTMLDDLSRYNARNTFEELLKLGVIPVVNENDTVSTYEIVFGDNDRLSALVTALTNADMLILLSDIDGMFTDDPNVNKDAKFIPIVTNLDSKMYSMGKESSGSDVGTGGMSAKLAAAQIATESGADMIIANGENVSVIEQILAGNNVGTLFTSNQKEDFKIIDYLSE